MENIILIVDDEQMILNSIKRLLRKQSRFSIVTANSAREALEKLNTIKPSVIISDMRMPEMDGLEFLSRAKEIAPYAVRMVLSAFADTDLIIDSINRGEVWRYLLKPWDDNDLIQAISNAVDLYESKKQERIHQAKISQLNKRLQSIIASVNDAVLVTDAEGQVILTNQKFKALNLDHIKLHPLEDFLTAIHSDRTLQEALATGKCTGKISNRFVDISIGKYDESLHQTAYLVLVIRDMTKEHELDQLKSEFVSSVSHELRTPLSSIIGFSKMMRRNDELAVVQRHEYLDIIKQEAERLSLLVENVLNLSSIESGTRNYNLRKCNLNDIVNDTLSVMTHDILSSELFINVEEKGSDYSISGDVHALKQVFLNLISNAIKFTPSGGTISVEIVDEVHSVRVIVSDTGQGIPEEEIPHIFDRFYRTKGQTAKGTGIGLHLVDEIVKAHHGTVAVESEIDNGTTFTISFPRS